MFMSAPTLRALAFTAFTLSSLSVFADEAASRPVNNYRVDFTVLETEGDKQVDSHSYSITLRERDTGKLRVGSNIPIATQSAGPSVSVMRSDVGANLDCRLEEQNGNIVISVNVEMSVIASPSKPPAPIIHKVQLSTVSAVAPGKPAIIASADDVAGRRRYQLEVTINRLK